MGPRLIAMAKPAALCRLAAQLASPFKSQSNQPVRKHIRTFNPQAAGKPRAPSPQPLRGDPSHTPCRGA